MSKNIYKSKKRLLCGVCGGIAEYFSINPIIVRLGFGFAFVTWWTGSVIIAYIIATIIIPKA